MRRCYHCMHPIEQEKAQTCPQCGQSLAAQPVDSVFLHPGTILQGKYLVGYPLGSGGFGNTYIGWNQFLDRRVAIKEFYPKQIIGRTREGRNVTMVDDVSESRFQKGLADFMKEAKNLASVKDIPGVVEVQAFFEENNTGYMVMEYLEGMDVRTALKQAGGRMDYGRSREIILSVLCTLRELHQRGMLHRDIAPDNIFLTKSGAVKLIDFGSARQAAALADPQTQILLKSGYTPLELRSAIVPLANIGANISWPLFAAGLIFSIQPLLTAGIVLFSLAVLFQLVTLPVEINASSRAMKNLESLGILGQNEKQGAKRVLSAAALTYVAALASSILQLLRLIILAGGRRRDD